MNVFAPPKEHRPAPGVGEPSFADALAAIEAAEELSPAQKRHWSTSLRQMAGYLDRPLTLIPTRIAAIAPAVKALHPARLGVHPKTFANHRSNARTALLWFNRQTYDSGRSGYMHPHYRALWDQIRDRYARDLLSPFLRFLSAHEVAPGDVKDCHVDAFMDHRKETSFGKTTSTQQRGLVRYWNACVNGIPGWPSIKLVEPPYHRRSPGPEWSEFPEGLRNDIDAYCARLATRHRTATGRAVRPCAPSTIALRRRELIAAARAAVAADIRIEELNSLSALVRPDRVEAIIDFYWRKNGERPALYTIDLASRFLALARSEPSFDPVKIARLEEIRICLEEHRSSGLTDKNRRLIREIAHGDIWRDVVRLPAKLMAEARSMRKTMPVKAAVTAELAIAVLILIRAPIRVQNLSAIRLGTNLVRPGGPGSPYMLVFPDYDVKNRVHLEFEFDRETTAVIDEYVYEHRPQLMRGSNHDCLFPGPGQESKRSHTLSQQISDRLWKELGLRITPHQFRHAAAFIMLQADPGNYELVRRVLGHRSLTTTRNFYIGLETLEATRQFGRIVTELEQDVPVVHKKRRRHDC